MMSRGVSSLYSPQSPRSSPPPAEDAPNHDFYKVSLMEEVDSGPEFRWKNRFYGVTPYKPSSTEEDLTPSPSATVAIGNRDSEEWRRSSEWEEPAAPAGKGDERREGEAESQQPHRNSEQPELTCSSLGDSPHSGVFRATLVELVLDPPAAPESPDTESHIQQDMDILVDTLRSMEPSLKRGSPAPRPQALPPQHMSSLPPIEEDATPDATPKKPEGNLNIPKDLGLGNSSARDTRSPLELMKSQVPSCRSLVCRNASIYSLCLGCFSFLFLTSNDASFSGSSPPRCERKWTVHVDRQVVPPQPQRSLQRPHDYRDRQHESPPPFQPPKLSAGDPPPFSQSHGPGIKGAERRPGEPPRVTVGAPLPPRQLSFPDEWRLRLERPPNEPPHEHQLPSPQREPHPPAEPHPHV